MRFSPIYAVATLSSVALAQPVAQLAARTTSLQETLDVLGNLTKEAHDIEVLHINRLSADNEAPLNDDIYRDIRQSFDRLGQGASVSFPEWEKPEQPFTDEECATVAGKYQSFASANQATLTALIEKDGIVGNRHGGAGGEELIDSLGHVEASYDKLASALATYCPQATPNEIIKSSQSSLKEVFKQVVDTLSYAP